MRPWIARAIVECASRLYGAIVAKAGSNRIGVHLTLLLPARSLATITILGRLSRAARNSGNDTEIP